MKAQGLSLALALHARSIPCSIYELRSPSVKSTGALNALTKRPTSSELVRSV